MACYVYNNNNSRVCIFKGFPEKIIAHLRLGSPGTTRTFRSALRHVYKFTVYHNSLLICV